MIKNESLILVHFKFKLDFIFQTIPHISIPRMTIDPRTHTNSSDKAIGDVFNGEGKLWVRFNFAV